MAFDPKCYELACYFLDDCASVTETKRNELAQRIQSAIEDYDQELLEATDLTPAHENNIQRKIEERGYW